MCIDFVRQKTFIEVDERGTRVASATGVGVGFVFEVDGRPAVRGRDVVDELDALPRRHTWAGQAIL